MLINGDIMLVTEALTVTANVAILLYPLLLSTNVDITII